jgi:hypothetical protein
MAQRRRAQYAGTTMPLERDQAKDALIVSRKSSYDLLRPGHFVQAVVVVILKGEKPC